MYFGGGVASELDLRCVGKEPPVNDPDWASLETPPVIDDVRHCGVQQNGGAHVLTSGQLSEEIDSEESRFSPMIDDDELFPSFNDIDGTLLDTRCPLFASAYADFTGIEDVLFVTPPTREGTTIAVTKACALGVCKCQHELGGVSCQLHPCRFAYLIYGDFLENPDEFRTVFEGVCEGFKIVDSEVESYECDNYLSILSEFSRPQMDVIIQRELAEGYLSVVKSPPTCVHAFGAVPKGKTGIRPITDCSRPVGKSVNSSCDTLVQKFSYSSMKDVVDLITPGSYLAIVDIQAAYRAVPIHPNHRQYLGSKWMIDGKERYLEDNRLCFGLTTGPYYFHSISTLPTFSVSASVLMWCNTLTII